MGTTLVSQLLSSLLLFSLPLLSAVEAGELNLNQDTTPFGLSQRLLYGYNFHPNQVITLCEKIKRHVRNSQVPSQL